MDQVQKRMDYKKILGEIPTESDRRFVYSYICVYACLKEYAVVRVVGEVAK
jgi:hypothetical protein